MQCISTNLSTSCLPISFKTLSLTILGLMLFLYCIMAVTGLNKSNLFCSYVWYFIHINCGMLEIFILKSYQLTIGLV